MRLPLSILLLSIAVSMAATAAAPQATAASPFPAVLDFDGVRYHARWNNGTQHEFVPEGTDLSRWTRMITLQPVPGVADADGMRRYAGELAGSFARIGRVLAHDCVPAIPSGEECRLVAVLADEGVAEFVVNRTLLRDGRATNASVARRAYGSGAVDAQLAYLRSPEGERHARQALAWPVPVRHAPAPAPAAGGTRAVGRPPAPPIEFAGLTWHAQATGGGDVEYLPEAQVGTEAPRDIMTLHATPEDALDAGLEAYTRRLEAIHHRRGGTVLSSECTPATATHVADCTLMVTFTGAHHVELAVAKHVQTRLGLVAASYAHREYGPAAGQQARAWIASPDGQRRVAGFIDWVDALALRMDAAPPR